MPLEKNPPAEPGASANAVRCFVTPLAPGSAGGFLRSATD
jgi:hypothetical protein